MAKKKAAKKRTTHVGFRRLKALGHERMAAIDDLLIREYTPNYVAQVVQEEWKELTDVKRTTLSRQLDRYKNQEIVGRIAVEQDKLSPAKEEKRKVILSRVAEDVNAIEELTELIHAQKSRLQKILNREEGMAMNLDQVGKDIRLLKDLIKDLADLQLETGMLRRAPKTFAGSLNLHQNDDIDAGLRDLSMDRATQDDVAKATEEALRVLGFLPEDAVYEEESDAPADDRHR